MTDTTSSDEQRVSYGFGRQFGEQIQKNSFEGIDIEFIKLGLEHAIKGEASIVDDEALNKAFQAIQAKMQAATAARAGEMGAEGEKFLAENAKKPEVTTTASGLQYEVLTEGSGEKPTAQSTVRTHYHGSLIDGTVFDSSVQRGQPAEFPVGGVIAGWTEALQMMTVGSKWKLTLPHGLAYGEQGAGADIPPFAALVFEVELLAIV